MIGKENQESNKKSNQPLQSNQTTTSEMSEREQKRQMLKTKLKLMRQDRTNSVYHQAKSNNSVPDDVLSEYMKLKKISKMPIPEPNEIFAHPEEYKPVISMLLQNNMMKQLNSSHPYVRYFKLIAEKIGLDMPLPMPTQDFLSGNNVKDNNVFEKLIKPTNPVIDIRGNVINKGVDTDTDSEGEDIQA